MSIVNYLFYCFYLLVFRKSQFIAALILFVLISTFVFDIFYITGFLRYLFYHSGKSFILVFGIGPALTSPLFYKYYKDREKTSKILVYYTLKRPSSKTVDVMSAIFFIILSFFCNYLTNVIVHKYKI
jgi:hypothetical protein